MKKAATVGHSTPVSTLQFFLAFLWRGVLLGLFGGAATAWVFVWCLFFTVILIEGTDVPLLPPLRYSVPAATAIGFGLGYIIATLDARQQRQRYAIVCALIGCILAAYPVFFIVLLASPIATIVGGVVGLILSVPITLVLAAVTRARHAPPTDKDGYLYRMRAIAIPLSFIGAFPTLFWFTRLIDGLHYSSNSPWITYGITSLIIGTFAAVAAWVFVPYLVNWYIDETLPSQSLEPGPDSASADDSARRT